MARPLDHTHDDAEGDGPAGMRPGAGRMTDGPGRSGAQPASHSAAL